jgi:RNA polymerase sigma factor for flagellar operon FliA
MTMSTSTPADDAALWVRFAATHDAATREEIILRYVPLVHYVLHRMTIEHSSEYEDLVSQGLLGLINAVDRFDATRGIAFSTYAMHRIRGHILDSLRSLDLLSRPARQRVRQMESAISELTNRMGRTPSDEELAGQMGLEAKQLQRAYQDASQVLLSLDAGGPDETEPYDVIADDSPDPLETMAENDTQAEVARALAALPEREQLVLSLYYRNGLTLKETGAVLNISESRVCQLHGRALMNLRSALHAPERAMQAQGVRA